MLRLIDQLKGITDGWITEVEYVHEGLTGKRSDSRMSVTNKDGSELEDLSYNSFGQLGPLDRLVV